MRERVKKRKKGRKSKSANGEILNNRWMRVKRRGNGAMDGKRWVNVMMKEKKNNGNWLKVMRTN